VLERSGCIGSTEAFLTALRLDKRTIRACAEAVKMLRTPPPGTALDWKKLLRRYGVDTVSCAARCADALRGGDSYRELHAVLKSGECFSLRHLAVTGDDLAALGFKGRELGDMLNFLLDYVMEYPANNRREPLLLLASRDEE
jgi:tRNA nucleotidyltransferase (CCA-adding enzyme)